MVTWKVQLRCDAAGCDAESEGLAALLREREIDVSAGVGWHIAPLGYDPESEGAKMAVLCPKHRDRMMSLLAKERGR